MHDNRTQVEILAHPVRLRLLSELAGRTATTRDLAASLTDVSQATLYRHVTALLEAGVLETVEGSPERDRMLRIAPGRDRLERDALRTATDADHRGYFATYVASLMDTFAAALDASSGPDMVDAGLSYNRVVVHLTEDERHGFEKRLNDLVQQMLQLRPGPDRRAYALASAVIPRPVREVD